MLSKKDEERLMLLLTRLDISNDNIRHLSKKYHDDIHIKDIMNEIREESEHIDTLQRAIRKWFGLCLISRNQIHGCWCNKCEEIDKLDCEESEGLE